MKGKSGIGGGKKGKSKNAGALVWNQQTGSPVASSVASSAPIGTIDTIECTSLDLCAEEIANPRWVAFNEDTGAGGTVWQTDAGYACDKVSGRNDNNGGRRTGTVSSSMSVCLGTPIAHDWRENVSSQTVVEQGTRILAGRRRWLHHPEKIHRF